MLLSHQSLNIVIDKELFEYLRGMSVIVGEAER